MREWRWHELFPFFAAWMPASGPGVLVSCEHGWLRDGWERKRKEPAGIGISGFVRGRVNRDCATRGLALGSVRGDTPYDDECYE